MQRIGLVLKRSDDQALVLGEKISHFLKDCGREVLLELSCEDLAARWNGRTTPAISDESDLLVVLGGDGTILRAVSLLNDKATPVLGVNLGRVGFIAEIRPEEALSELQAAIEGTAIHLKRMMLQLTLPNGKRARVLNEVVIHWASIARLIDLGIRMGDSREIELRADGLIVATPIGSSAYSYAASGPLVHPDVEGVVLTPICPYWGLKRPLLVPPHMEIELVLKRGENLKLTLDGHTSVDLEPGNSLRIARSPIPFLLVSSRARDYFDVLKEKLGLC